MVTKQTDKRRQYFCRVEASCPGQKCSAVYTFDVTVKAKDQFDAIGKAEDLVDRKIRLGRFNFPYDSADLIDCVSIN